MLSDDLFRRVSINTLGALVPAGDNTVQVFAVNRILGGINDRSQARPVFSQLLGGSAMQFFVGAAQFFRDALAVTDVADRAQDEQSSIGVEGTKADLYREFGAIAASSVEIEIRSHAARLRGFREVCAMLVVLGAIRLGDKYFDLLADQFDTGIAKERLRLRIDLDDGSLAIDGDDGIRQRLQQITGKENIRQCIGR